MIRKIAFAAALGLALSTVAGCSKPANEQDSLLQEAREAGDDLTAVQAPPATGLRVVPDEAPTKEPPAETFAGTYQGTMPCEGCASDAATLTLSADGNYSIQRPGANPGSNGSWISEEGGNRIRLDPVRKADGSQLWAVSSRNTLQRLDDDGTPLARDVKPETLRRMP